MKCGHAGCTSPAKAAIVLFAGTGPKKLIRGCDSCLEWISQDRLPLTVAVEVVDLDFALVAEVMEEYEVLDRWTHGNFGLSV